MKQTIVVLKSKTQVLHLVEISRSFGLQVKTIPIPKEVKVGCGLCVQINYTDASKIMRIVKRYNLDAFYGVFFIEKIGSRSSFKRIY